MSDEIRHLDWNSAYASGNTPWDKGAPAPALLEFLERHRMEGRVLVPGCGLGHDARAIAAQDAGKVLGVDVAERAVAAAQALVNPPNLRFEQGDFLQQDGVYDGGFDWVFEHTCISGLHPSLLEDYAAAVARALRPGGRYLAIFFLQPWDEGETPEPPPYGITTERINRLFKGLLELREEWIPSRHFPGREGRELMRVYGSADS